MPAAPRRRRAILGRGSTPSSAPNITVRNDNFIPEPRFTRITSRVRLPHWQVDQAVYFITFRLNDSLPLEVLRALKSEREQLLREAERTDRGKIDAAFSLRLDQELDRGVGACVLREHAEVVAETLMKFDRARYELHAWCVMPNHVHAMLYLERGGDLPRILHSWKSYTAHAIGRGAIWQREYFDRVVRSPREFSDTMGYIRSNPAKAGLRDWPWVG